MDWHEYIEQKPEVMFGKPVIRETRITVEQILQDLSDGASEREVLEAYPRLQPEHIRAALAYAAAAISSDVTLFPHAATG